ncbi:TAXI family TRAP transporter solute-binding subunit [Umezawaea endophytica]|uniref:TAXI family TRAP transporter solute-binding subunit n=1 Tax=Umezawaea endophytica TaxID=1654476 RepID=A0A9X2VKG0_9PSEU|nr:TAXI family TRAP transporter solute-binding subunit [Umezawaea endophytica]MCS7478270.1 TAXI family TRAP transporter solute-binding subunit [Umezawaea endophytica]
MSPSRRTVLLAALAAGLPVAACTSTDAPELAELVLATGPAGAVFREIGGALAAALADQLPNTRVVAKDTSASVENLRLLKAGEAQLGLSSLDSVANLDDLDGIKAIGRLYDSFLHLVVPEASPIRTFADLAGRRVSLGPVESGTEFTAVRLLRLLGVQAVDVRMAHADSAKELEKGTIDAFMALTGIPTPAISGLVAARFPIRLVPLAQEAQALTTEFRGPYVPATIPATTYGDVPANDTVSVPNLLLAIDSLSDDVVEVVTRTVFTESARIAAEHPEAGRINVRTGIATGQVPLHPGAARWFRSVKR